MDGKILASKEMNAGYSHAENLTPFCTAVLEASKLTFKDLSAIVVSKGPGSYTGLRIGVSTAKGFCYALSIPLLSIPTLKHLALQVSKEHTAANTLFCPMLDARRMEVYCGLYDSANVEISATEAKIIDENSFSDSLAQRKILFFGDGAAKCKNFLGQHPNAVFMDSIFPSSNDMVSLAEEKYFNKEFEDVAYFEPFYLKDFLVGGK